MPTLVVHIIIDLETGGAELMLKRLIAAHSSNLDFRHRVISLRTLGKIGPELQALGIPVEALGMTSALGLLRVVGQLVRRLRQCRPDVVHTWMYHADLLGGLAARIAGCRAVIWAVRTTSVGKEAGVAASTKWLQRLCALLSASLPTVIVYVAEAARRSHEALGYANAKGMVIANGYAIPETIPVTAARARLGIPAGQMVVGSVGRFNDAKDPRSFVEAAAVVARATPEVCFMMVGRGLATANRTLMGWISEHGLEDRFVLLGERKNIVECLAAMDVFCLHSVTEAFPNVVAEAMSVGVACVVTDVGDAALLLGDAGVVVPARDPRAIATAISTMIEAGPDVRAAYGRRGRERIATCFSLDLVVRRYEALYRDLVANARYFPPQAREVQS